MIYFRRLTVITFLLLVFLFLSLLVLNIPHCDFSSFVRKGGMLSDQWHKFTIEDSEIGVLSICFTFIYTFGYKLYKFLFLVDINWIEYWTNVNFNCYDFFFFLSEFCRPKSCILYTNNYSNIKYSVN